MYVCTKSNRFYILKYSIHIDTGPYFYISSAEHMGKQVSLGKCAMFLLTCN